MDLGIPCLAEEGTGTASELRVSWGIEFDWTGEARSKLGVEVGVPGKCECSYPFSSLLADWHWVMLMWYKQANMDSSTGQASDGRKSITGIPTLFDTLVHGGEDPLTATKTVVALLAGEPTS